MSAPTTPAEYSSMIADTVVELTQLLAEALGNTIHASEAATMAGGAAAARCWTEQGLVEAIHPQVMANRLALMGFIRTLDPKTLQHLRAVDAEHDSSQLQKIMLMLDDVDPEALAEAAADIKRLVWLCVRYNPKEQKIVDLMTP
jgi:hypothetical protein